MLAAEFKIQTNISIQFRKYTYAHVQALIRSHKITLLLVNILLCCVLLYEEKKHSFAYNAF